jgi:branched-chain amino acid transport system permease protein
MELALQAAANGGLLSVFYALMAIGFTLMFGVMGIANLAHGELYMIGAYATWLTYGQDIMPFPVAVLVGTAVVIGIGLAIERSLFRPMRNNAMMSLIVSIGLIFILQVFVATTWHVGLMKHIPPYIKGSLEVFGVSASLQRLMVIPVAASLLGGLWFFLNHVKQGQALRATAQDPEAAYLQGISIDRTAIIAMAIAAGLAGVAGGLMAPIMRVDPYMGHPAIIAALMVTIVGGMGNIRGAVLASFIYGFLISFVTTYVDGLIATIAGVLLMFIALVIRPKGLLERA